MRALGARYATFIFSDDAIFLNVLLYDLNCLHGYMLPRLPGEKPVDTFRRLSNLLGRLWWSEVDRGKKGYLATRTVLGRASKESRMDGSIRPVVEVIPTARDENLVRLELTPDDLQSDDFDQVIKAAYRKMAMKNHPDKGGDGKAFRKIQEAYEQLSEWARNPVFRTQKGLVGRWFYSGGADRWTKPLRQQKEK